MEHQNHRIDDDNEENESSLQQAEDSDLEWLALCQITAAMILTYYEKYIYKVPCRTSIRTGHLLISEILEGNEMRCYQDFRLKKSVFLDLCQDLTERYGLVPTKRMTVYEEVGMFLMTCGYGVGNRLIQEMFNHSAETISRHFHRVLQALGGLVTDIIKPNPNYNNGVGYHKPQNRRYIPFFKDCIGAIDGTHVKARLPRGQEIPFFGRKGYTTQNILAVVDFNMCFTFAWAGWEGAAHDNRIFGEAIRRPELNFPHPHGDKYYLIDAGYSHKKGYMGPYKGDNIRYHLEDFRRARTSRFRVPRGYKEMFNYLHSSCRNIVERTFGVWKARFKILDYMPYYSFETQREIVLATMAIHNYIRKKGSGDNAFLIAESENYVPSTREAPGTSRQTYAESEAEQSDLHWIAVRDAIAEDIWNST